MSHFTVLTYFNQQNKNEDNAGHPSDFETATLSDAQPQKQLKCICCEASSNGSRGSSIIIFPGRTIYRLSAYPRKSKFFREYYRPVYASVTLLKNHRAIAKELDNFVSEMAIKLDSFTDIWALITPASKHSERYKLHVFEQRTLRHIGVSTISEDELRLIQGLCALKKYAVSFATVNIKMNELVAKGDIFNQLTVALKRNPDRINAYYLNEVWEKFLKEDEQKVETQENGEIEQVDQLEEESDSEEQNDKKQKESQDVYWIFLKKRALQLDVSASEEQNENKQREQKDMHWDNESGDQDKNILKKKQEVHWERLKQRVVQSEYSESENKDENRKMMNEDIAWPELQTELHTLYETEAASKLIDQDVNSVQIEYHLDPLSVQFPALDGEQLNNNETQISCNILLNEATVENSGLQKSYTQNENETQTEDIPWEIKLDKTAKKCISSMNCSRLGHLTKSMIIIKAELCKKMLKKRAEKKLKLDIKRRQKQLDCQNGNQRQHINKICEKLENEKEQQVFKNSCEQQTKECEPEKQEKQAEQLENKVEQQLEQYVELEYQKKHLASLNQQQFDVLEYKKETEMLIIDSIELNIDQLNKKDDQLKKHDVQKKETKYSQQDKNRLRLKHILNLNPLESKKRQQQQKEENVQRKQPNRNIPSMKKTVQKDNFRNDSWLCKESQMLKNPLTTLNRFREDTNLVMKHEAQTKQTTKDNKVENEFRLIEKQSEPKRELQLQTKFETSLSLDWSQMKKDNELKVQNSNIEVFGKPVIQKEQEIIDLNLNQLEKEIVQDLNELAASIVPNSEQQECKLDVKNIQNKTALHSDKEWIDRKDTMMKILLEKRQKREAQQSKPTNIVSTVNTKSTNSNSFKASSVRRQFQFKADLSRQMVTKRSEERLKLDIKRRQKQLDMQLKTQDVPKQPSQLEKKDEHQKKCPVQTEDEKESLMVNKDNKHQLQPKKIEVLKNQDVHEEEQMHALNIEQPKIEEVQQREHLVPTKAEENTILIKDELKKVNKLQPHNEKTEDLKKRVVQNEQQNQVINLDKLKIKDEQLKVKEKKETSDQIVKDIMIHVGANHNEVLKNQDARGDKEVMHLKEERHKEHLKEILTYEQPQEEIKQEVQYKPFEELDEREQRKQKLFLLRNEREQLKKSQPETKVTSAESELCKPTSTKSSKTKKIPKECSKVQLNRQLRDSCQSWLTKDRQNEQQLRAVMATTSQEARIIPKVQNSTTCDVPKGTITATSATNKGKKQCKHVRFHENVAGDEAIRFEEPVQEPSDSGSSLNSLNSYHASKTTTHAVATNTSQALSSDSDSTNSNHTISQSLLVEIKELLDKINMKEQPLMSDINEFFHIAIQKNFKIYVRPEVKFSGSSNETLQRCRLECFENNDGNKFIGSVALLHRQLTEMILMKPQLEEQLHFIDDAFNLTKMPQSITRGFKRICDTLKIRNVYNVVAELTYEFVQNDNEKLDEPEMS